MKLEDNIKKICEDLSEELVNDFDRDKAMILNNLCEYVLPKKQRSAIVSNISSDKNYKITYEYNSHPGTPATDEEPKEVQSS